MRNGVRLPAPATEFEFNFTDVRRPLQFELNPSCRAFAIVFPAGGFIIIECQFCLLDIRARSGADNANSFARRCDGVALTALGHDPNEWSALHPV